MADFVQIVEDGSGKRIGHYKRYIITLSVLNEDLNQFSAGDIITIQNSDTEGVFLGFSNVLGNLEIIAEDVTNNAQFTQGSNLIINAISVGPITSIVPIFTSQNSIVDRDIPDYGLNINRDGSAKVTFTEGDIGFDAFGHAQTSQTKVLDSHSYIYGDRADRYTDVTVGTSSITANITESSLVLSVDNASGSIAKRTSNQYYSYIPGEGTVLMTSVSIGDTGKANCVRRWGLGDDEDGVFFELDGTSFNVLLRSSASGSVVEERVARGDFSETGLENPDTDPFVIDFSKVNIYYIDFQWLGAGKIRFGVIGPDGTRTILHELQNANQRNLPYMKRGTLPLQLEIENTAATASSSEMRLVCASILRQSLGNEFEAQTKDSESPLRSVTENLTYIGSFRPSQTFNGVTNRVSFLPYQLEVISIGSPVIIYVIVNSSLTAPTWNPHNQLFSSAEVDYAASGFTEPYVLSKLMFQDGVTIRDLEESLENALKLGADGTTQPTFTLAAKTYKAGQTSEVIVISRWKELI